MDNNLNGRKIAYVLRKAGFNKVQTSPGMIIRSVSRDGYSIENIGSYYTASYHKCNRNADTKPEVERMMKALEEAGYTVKYGSDLKDWFYIKSYNN